MHLTCNETSARSSRATSTTTITNNTQNNMKTFKAYKYLADTRGEFHTAVQILAEMDYQVPPLPQVNPGRYNVIRVTGSGDVEFLPQDVFDLIALPTISLKGLREMVGEQKDARIAQLETQLKQSQHTVDVHAERTQRAESLYQSKSEALDNANGKLLHQKKHLDRLEADLADFGEANLSLKNKLEHERQLNDKLRSVKEALKRDIGHERRRLVSKQEQLDACRRHLHSMTANRDELVKKFTEVGKYVSELNEKLRFRDQVIDSQKRMIQEWTQAYVRVSKELEALQAENEDLSKWSQEASQMHATVLGKLDGLETKIVESHRQHKAVCEFKDIRIADLERELNTCKANYNRLLWLKD